GTVRGRRTVEGGYVSSLAFSPDGRTLAGGTQKGMLTVWDAAGGRVRWTELAHGGGVNHLACSPDGMTLVSAGSTSFESGRPGGPCARWRPTPVPAWQATSGARVATGDSAAMPDEEVEASRLAGIDAAYGALADLSFSVDDFLREKHEEMRREEERDQRYLKE